MDEIERLKARIEALEAALERQRSREQEIWNIAHENAAVVTRLRADKSVFSENWAYVCGKLAASTNAGFHPETMPDEVASSYRKGFSEVTGEPCPDAAALPHP